jgi:RNA polymerase sigma-70 factor (ECF subfamily)
MTDIDTLTTRWLAGDERAAEAIYDRHRDRTYRLAYGLLGNPADAEEIVQDALAYALANIARYDSRRASFSTWLHTITISRCRDRLRRRRRRQSFLAALLRRSRDVLDPTPGQEQRVVEVETRGEILEAVQSLSPPLREAILLRYWAGHTYREMAEIMGCPTPTAQSRVRLAYRHLRTALTPDSLGDLEARILR